MNFKNIFNYIIDTLIIYSPGYWIMNDKYSKSYDDIINELLDNNTTIIIKDNYVSKIGNLSVWTENYPYAYGTVYTIDTPKNIWNQLRDVRPSRRTILRLRRAINQQVITDLRINLKMDK